MAERLRIVIGAPTAHPDFLTVHDAMNQILDHFALASADDPESKEVGWKLAAISMQSPVTVEGEAISLTKGVNVDLIARRQIDRLSRGLQEIRQGRVPKEWTHGESGKIVERILARNKNGIGKTEVYLRDDPAPIDITPQIAEKAIEEIEKQKRPASFFGEDRSRDEFGLLDGYLIAVGAYHNLPAIQIVDRLTEDEIWCRVPEDVRDKIAESADFNDVWKRSRVLVKGLIRYDQSGKIISVFNSEVCLVSAKQVSVDDIRDTGFTSGLRPSQYLEKLREGGLG